MILPWYFMTDLVFCGLAAAAVVWAWPKLGPVWRTSAWMTAVLVMILQTVNEYLSLMVFEAWTFSFEYNRLIGWSILGTPVEEYLFWFSFAWLVPFFYSGWVAVFGDRDRRKGAVVGVDAHE